MRKKIEPIPPFIQTHVSDWLRELWEVELQHPPMIGSALKFLAPPPRKPAKRKAKKVAAAR